MRKFLNLPIFLLFAIVAIGQDQTLADFLQEHKIPLPSDPHIHVNDQPAKTLMPLETEDEFALAYRLVHDGTLYGPVQFIRYNKHTDRWTSLDVGPPEYRFQATVDTHCDGMVGGMTKNFGRYVIKVQLNPSAGCDILVRFDEKNTPFVEAVIDGGVAGFIPPATVIYSGNMVHFSDVHPETLWTYDLRSKKATQVYPQPNDPFRRDFATKLEKIIDQNLCAQRNWACEPDRFSSLIDLPPAIDATTNAIAFGATFLPEGFMDRYPAEDSGLFDDEDYTYIFQLDPFRWREFSTYDLKPKFGTTSTQQLISPGMIGKVFATPAPD